MTLGVVSVEVKIDRANKSLARIESSLSIDSNCPDVNSFSVEKLKKIISVIKNIEETEANKTAN
jgi:hypothetical protein